jgi:hypothetical protein
MNKEDVWFFIALAMIFVGGFMAGYGAGLQ